MTTEFDDYVRELGRSDGPNGFVGFADFTALLKLAEFTPPPDETGKLEGQFSAPIEEVVALMCQIVSANFSNHMAYTVYAETMRGTERGDAAMLFRRLAFEELDEAKYLLQRISALSPGDSEIPAPNPPEVCTDPTECVRILISNEQQTGMLFKHLRRLIGEKNPMRFKIEEILADGQGHADQLWQLMPTESERQSEDKGSRIRKVAAYMKKATPDVPASAAGQVVTPDPPATPEVPLEEEAQKNLTEAQVDAPIAVPAPGQEPVEEFVAREKMLLEGQHAAENEHLRATLAQTQAAMQQAQEQAAAASNAVAQATQAQAQTAMMTEQAQQQAQMAQQQAVEAEDRAATHATQKMQLGMRVNQMRQAIAELAMQNPVQETAANVSDVAAQGAPATPEQAMQAVQAAALQQQAQMLQAAGDGSGNKVPDRKVEKEMNQAASAQQNAQEQTVEAANAVMTGGQKTAMSTGGISKILARGARRSGSPRHRMSDQVHREMNSRLRPSVAANSFKQDKRKVVRDMIAEIRGSQR